MKKLNLMMVMALVCVTAYAQTDSTKAVVKRDTMRIGNILIIKKGSKDKDTTLTMTRNDKVRKSNSHISTNYFVFDFGFSNYDDQTNYANTGDYLYNRPGAAPLTASDFKIKNGKSINVNLWFFMQKLDLVKKNVSLKYGLGLELNNYRYKSNISYKDYNQFGQYIPYILRDSISFSKNKLAADYITVPLLLRFASNKADQKKGISVSAGVSGGYLYSQRNKQISDERGKKRNKGDYDLNRFKFSYIGELGIGPVKLYGSYSPKSFYNRGLDMKPYTIGLRFSNW